MKWYKHRAILFCIAKNKGKKRERERKRKKLKISAHTRSRPRYTRTAEMLSTTELCQNYLHASEKINILISINHIKDPRQLSGLESVRRFSGAKLSFTKRLSVSIFGVCGFFGITFVSSSPYYNLEWKYRLDFAFHWMFTSETSIKNVLNMALYNPYKHKMTSPVCNKT